jgi:hypothetical protein
MSDMHTVMPKRLAQALVEAGMKHFASGGQIAPGSMTVAGGTSGGGGGVTALPNQSTTSDFSGITNNQITNPGGILGGNNSVANQILNPIGAFGGSLLGMTQDQYQAGVPNITKQNFQPQISNLQNQQQSVYGQQQTLANQLLAQSQGQGPNVAQDQLNQSTAANVANQGALMAGQRGGSANVGLLARQAAQQGANTQQQAAGQAATLGSQQQLAAEGALQTGQSNMANENLQGQSIEQGAQASQNTAINTGELGAQGINANTAAANAQATNGLLGGLMGGAGSAISSIFYKGGEVQKLADGGDVNDNIGIAQYSNSTLPPAYSSPPAPTSSSKSGGGGGGAGIASLAALLSKGGQIPFSNKLLKGGTVPGKAEVQGNSPKNDTQPTLLSPGEEVLPRSVTMAKDAPERAAEFVRHLQKNKEKKGGYEKVTSSRKSLEERVKHLEKLCGGGYA